MDKKSLNWIKESLEAYFGTDPETEEPANVRLLGWRWEIDPITKQRVGIHATCMVWDDPEPAVCFYSAVTHDWEVEGDPTGCLILDGIEW